jgi:putative ABC transport system permease protein
MRTSTLLWRNLRWYWRTNLAVLLGVATAAGVLGGAAMVGDSVRASLRELALSRLGNADLVLSRNGYFREDLAAGAAPLIALEARVTHEADRRRASQVEVYGVDERFWKFQGFEGEPPRGRELLLTAALAGELGAKPGDTVLLRVEKPSAIPLESIQGRKEDTGTTVRLEMRGVAPREFSLRAGQGELRAAYVPLTRLRREIGQPGKINTVVAGKDWKPDVQLEDMGIRLRGEALETDSTVISDALAETATAVAGRMGLRADPVSTYMANRIAASGREVPYSTVTALTGALAPARDDGIVLNDWLARELAAKVGDAVTLEYYRWRTEGRLDTETAAFRVERIVPLAGEAADRTLAPEYPGISDSRSLHDWDPPFPLDMGRVRPADERYWEQYRATPKAFVTLARGRALWGTRFGSLTSLRIRPGTAGFADALRAALDPARMGMELVPVKARALEAARGNTDFGEYFLYFSFFLVVSALLLTGLFFRLGVEQRTREIGTLRALGFSNAKIRRLFLLEGALLAVGGSLAGVAVALAYGALILFGLRTWWVDAVGTRLLTLHPSAVALGTGALAGIVTGLGAVAWTLRGLGRLSPRGLMAGPERTGARRWRWVAGLIAVALAAPAMGAGAEGFFGAGSLLLIGALLLQSAWLHAGGLPARGQLTLALRGVSFRPGRAILCIALIASATFLVVSLDAFKREGSTQGTGGFPLLADSLLPLVNRPAMEGVEFVPFRVRPGDDASCLNLYQPRNPRIVAPPASFLREAKFAFQGAAEKAANPWMLLESEPVGGVIPAIADANSMTYALHLKLGEVFTLNGAQFRIVAALQDSLFQGELLISEKNFLRLFPEAQGFRFFLIRAAADKAGAIEDEYSDYGLDVQAASARLAGYHKVENTYLATFRALGGLGLILGTVGLGAILLRNALERRRELALLRAVGYRPRHLAVMVLAENAFLLVLGVATGTLCALVAIAPALRERGGQMPWLGVGALLITVLVTGTAASLVATAAALRSPVLEALRSE